MSTLNEYLVQKGAAHRALKERIQHPDFAPPPLSARVSAEGRSGIRRIRIRDFQLVSDAAPDYAGYNLGPTSPELQLGVLGSCVTHITLIQATELGVPLDSLEVEVEGVFDPRGGKPGFEHIPVYPQDLRYTIHIVSPASAEAIAELHALVERTCPILNLLRHPQEVVSTVSHRQPAETVTAGA
ncbi:putative OsmC-like protein [Azospirillum agricola]|uniref:OsmC family protein n=1 Tax=Azospirillum agricola TaxID=1720247 RepID=UPI001AE28E0D|nr:OsmC family protein [Azospirillum agricola]MBP2230438.1 putative OsmC-like protein [Azospirillum agricola]